MQVELINGDRVPDGWPARHADMLMNPANCQYLEVRWHLPQTVEQCLAWVRNEWHFYIRAKLTSDNWFFAGTIGATIDRYNSSAELGFFVNAPKVRNGIGSAAVDAICQRLAAAGVHSAHAGCHASNVASAKTLTRCGFTFVGAEPDKMRSPLDGKEFEDRLVFGRIL